MLKKISDLQFQIKYGTDIQCSASPIKVNVTLDAPKSARSTPRRKGKPKISTVAIALDRLLTNKYSAHANVNGQVKLVCDEKKTYYFDGQQTMYLGSESDDPSSLGSDDNIDMIAAILASAAAKKGECFETASVLDACLEEYDSESAVNAKTIAHLCDCFYYDVMNAYGTKVGLIDTCIDVREYDEKIARTYDQAVTVGQLGDQNFSDTLKPFFGFDGGSSVSGAEKKIKIPGTPSGMTFLDKCIDGVYEIGYEWDDESQARIQPPSFLETFVTSRAFEMTTNLCYKKLSRVVERMDAGRKGLDAIGKDYVNLIYVGKPGTGKTTIANALSATLGLPIYTCRLSKNTEEDEVEGKTKIAEGSFVFKETPFLKGYTTGGILVLEEFNLADPAVMQGALGQAIESPFILMKDGVEPVRRHPLAIIISTMNTGTQGSKEPNEAFASRHPFVFSVEDPKESDFVNILMANTGASAENCRKVYNAYTTIQNYLVKSAGSEDIAMSVTLRHCIGALELLEIEDFNNAIYDTMIGAIKIKDLEIAETVFNSCVRAKKY